MDSTTTITVPFSGRRRTRAFTLTEVLIAMALAGIISSALFASWSFIARSTVSIANYTEMNTAGRIGLDTFSRDVRMARDIRDFSDTGMTLIMDDSAAERIHYVYDPDERVLIRQTNVDEDVLFRDIDELILSRFTVLRTPATNDLETKQIQLELRMVRQTLNRDASKKIVSARYIMRNKRVST